MSTLLRRRASADKLAWPAFRNPAAGKAPQAGQPPIIRTQDRIVRQACALACAGRRLRGSVFDSGALAANFPGGTGAGDGANPCTQERARSPRDDETEITEKTLCLFCWLLSISLSAFICPSVASAVLRSLGEGGCGRCRIDLRRAAAAVFPDHYGAGTAQVANDQRFAKTR